LELLRRILRIAFRRTKARIAPLRFFLAEGRLREMTKKNEEDRCKTTVLVVDDDLAVRESLKFSLELEGFPVWVYGDGQDVLDDPDIPEDGCLIIDQVMPGMSGLEIIDALRRRGDLNPAILMVSHANQMVRDRAATRGLAVVEKPFFGLALLDAIYDAIAAHR
jgi:two-component system, LuxR family, response regulator FixJ